MIKITEQLRGMRGNYATYEDLVMRCCDIADEIEREVEERYVEGPTDKNGNPITYDTKIHQWGALEYIACKIYPDGTHEWFVRGHDISAPLLKANDVEICEPPTVEDLLRDFAYCCEEGATVQSIDEIIAEYAAKLQIRED